MKFKPTSIPDVLIIEPTVFEDERGWFMERFNEQRFHEGLRTLSLPVPSVVLHPVWNLTGCWRG